MNTPPCELAGRAAGSRGEELGKLVDMTATSTAAAHAIGRMGFIDSSWFCQVPDVKPRRRSALRNARTTAHKR
jgi:hypothetical protein